MEVFKKLEQYAMRLLSEAEDFADEYVRSEKPNLKDMFYSLTQGHLDLYMKVKSQIAAEANRIEREHPEENISSILHFLRDFEDTICEKVRNKLNR